MRTRYDLSRHELATLLADEPRYRVDQVWDGLHRRAAAPEELTEVPKALRARLAAELPAALRPVADTVSDAGDTRKWLWELHDGVRIETVLMLYRDSASRSDGRSDRASRSDGRSDRASRSDGRSGRASRSDGRSGRASRSDGRSGRATVCVSTQAGCAMGCGFCATGQAGFVRNLSVGEIVEQVVEAVRAARPRRLSNVVFMGMGEPLANYDRTWGAVERIHDDLGLSARHLTLSTVGIVPGIRRLAKEALPVNLAVSLHAAEDGLRDELVPINKRYPLADLTAACEEYLAAKSRRLSFEWALIDGVNDRRIDASHLSRIARPLRAHVNLIPLNPTPGWPTRGTPADGVRRFRDLLVDLGVNATVRRNRGTDISAACGQLVAISAPSP